MVTNGKILRNSGIRLIRDGVVVFTGELASLKRFKDDVKEVKQGYECGIMIEKYNLVFPTNVSDKKITNQDLEGIFQ